MIYSTVDIDIEMHHQLPLERAILTEMDTFVCTLTAHYDSCLMYTSLLMIGDKVNQ